MLLVLELAVVEDATHGRLRFRGDLHQVEKSGFGEAQCVFYRHDAGLRAVRIDHTHLRGADSTVDSMCLFRGGNETWASTAIRQMTSFALAKDYNGPPLDSNPIVGT